MEHFQMYHSLPVTSYLSKDSDKKFVEFLKKIKDFAFHFLVMSDLYPERVHAFLKDPVDIKPCLLIGRLQLRHTKC